MLHQENTDQIPSTDLMDCLILFTFGEFINRCPDQISLQEFLKELVLMREEEKEPSEIVCANEEQYHSLQLE